MAAKLKLFVTSDGLTEYVVAATSRVKALAAWGASQNLFKDGQARQIDDHALAAAALSHPGEVQTRRTDARLPRPPPSLRSPKGPTAAQRRRIADLEQRLAALETGLTAAKAEIALARESLDRREAESDRRYDNERRALETRLAAAKRATTS
jgi:hypothetical protein